MRATGTTLAALVAAVGLSGCLGGTQDVADMSCDDLADEAVALSEDASVQLLKVRSPRVVEDHRDDYAIPNGGGENVVLACQGEGAWSDGDTTPVRLEMTVDQDRDFFVGYRAE